MVLVLSRAQVLTRVGLTVTIHSVNPFRPRHPFDAWHTVRGANSQERMGTAGAQDWACRRVMRSSRNCETVELWPEVVDLAGVHSFTAGSQEAREGCWWGFAPPFAAASWRRCVKRKSCALRPRCGPGNTYRWVQLR